MNQLVIALVILLLMLRNVLSLISYYVDQSLPSDITAEKKYSSLQNALLDAAESGGIIYLKEHTSHTLDDVVILKNSLEILTDGYESNAGIQSSFAEILFIKGGIQLSIGELNFSLNKIKLNQKGLSTSSGEKILIMKQNNTVSLRNLVIEKIEALDITAFIYGLSLKAFFLDSVQIQNVKNNIVTNIICLENSNQIKMNSVSIKGNSFETGNLFSIIRADSLIVGNITIESSSIYSAITIIDSKTVTVSAIYLKGNILLSTSLNIKDGNGLTGGYTLTNLTFLQNKKRSDSEPVPQLIRISYLIKKFCMNQVKIVQNEAIKQSVLALFEECVTLISMEDFEISGNMYVEEALSFFNVLNANINSFKCLENNENSNSGNACILSMNVLSFVLNNSLISSNFANSITCGLIFDQSDDFEVKLTPYKKSDAIIYIGNTEFRSNEVRAGNPNIFYSGTSIFLHHDGVMKLEDSFFILNTHYYNKRQKNVIGSPCLDSISESNLLFIKNSKFHENKATAGSNCLTFAGYRLEVGNSDFFMNDDYSIDTASYMYKPFTFGGGVQFGSDINVFHNVNFTDNRADYAGSMGFFVKKDFYLQTLDITNVLFERNVAYDKGGAFFLQNYNRLSWLIISFTNCNFFDNSAEKEGGAAYNHGILEVNSKISIVNSVFLRNQGTRGAVFFNAILNFNSDFINCTFSYNVATSNTDGGSVFYNDDNHDLNLFNCLVSNNRAKMRGGVSQLMKGRLFDFGSVFINNSAGYIGGVFILHRVSEVTLKDSLLKNSYSAVSGGTCFLMQSTKFEMINVTIENGTSERGGAISIMQEANLTLTGTKFLRCISSVGAIIYSINTLTLIVMNSITVEENTVRDTGLIYLLFSSIQIAKLYFRLNKGTLFNIKEVEANFSEIKAELQLCQKTNADGCLINAETSKINLLFCNFSSINMKDRSIGFSFASSNIFIEGTVFKEIIGERSPSFIKAIKIESFTIMSSSFINFARQAVYIDNSILLFSKNVIEIEQNANQGNPLEEGFMVCLNCMYSHIEGSLFTNIKSKVGGALQIVASKANLKGNLFTISNSEFVKNKASNEGGSINVKNGNVHLVKNFFDSNTASVGGAIHLNCTSEAEECEWLIESCTFSNNNASSSGGALFWRNSFPMEKNNIFSKNSAKHGPDKASTPLKLMALNESFEDLVSGQTQTKALEFHVVDGYNQICSSLSTGQASIAFNTFEEKPEYLQAVQGNDFFMISEGKIMVDKARFISLPGQPAHMIIKTNTINFYSRFVEINQLQGTSKSHKNYSGYYYYSFEINFRPCKRGEIHKKIENICSVCLYGTYSFDPEKEKCLDCPENAICTGSEILATTNYWRESENSTVLHECNVLKDACPGGEFKSICNPGYWGPLCGTCLYNNNDKYFKNSFLSCKKCSDGISPFGVLISVLILVLLVFVIIMTIRASFNIEKKQNKSMLTILNCILINYMQILSLLGNIDIKWPSMVESSSQVFDFAGDLDRIVGVLECPLSEIGLTNDVSVYTVKIAAGSIFFLSFFFFTFSFWWGFHLYKGVDVKNKIIISIISIYLLTLQPMIKFYSKNFNCVEIDDKSYLKGFPSLECYTGEHISLVQKLVVPAFLLILVVPLSLMLFYLIHNRNNLETLEVKQRAFVIINPYKKEYFYWEYCIFAKRISLIFTSIFLNSTPLASCLALMAIIFLSSLMQIKIKPFKHREFNKLEIIQNMAIYITFSSALFFSYTEESSGRLMLYIFLLSGNSIFITTWLKLYITVYAKTKHITMKTFSKSITSFVERVTIKKKSSKLSSPTTSTKNLHHPH